ncbi:hypothetical protein Tco_1257602 [Tanacetum coccineum]
MDQRTLSYTIFGSTVAYFFNCLFGDCQVTSGKGVISQSKIGRKANWQRDASAVLVATGSHLDLSILSPMATKYDFRAELSWGMA